MGFLLVFGVLGLGACTTAASHSRPDMTPLAAPRPDSIANGADPLLDGVTRDVLPNGMEVVVKPYRAAPVAAIQVWVRVGSSAESPEEAGAAHALEHMLFKGTGRRGVGELARDIEELGGDVNAWTNYDETVYHAEGPASAVFGTLEVLADAVGHAAVNPAEWAKEREVILEELRMSRDDPDSMLFERLYTLAFPGHPYSRPILGNEPSLKAMTRERLADFARRLYVPRNLVLVVVGDVDPDAVQAKARELFAPLADAPPPPPPPPVALAPKLSDPEAPTRQPESLGSVPERATLLVQPTQARHHAVVGFPLPPFDHPDAAALDLLAVLLGESESSRLEQEVVRGAGLAEEADAGIFPGRAGGLFHVRVAATPRKLGPALSAALAQIAEIRIDGVSRAELHRARTLVENALLADMETAEGQAQRLGHHAAIAGDLAYGRRWLAAVRAVTPADVARVAHTWLHPDAARAVVSGPPDGEGRKPSARRSATPRIAGVDAAGLATLVRDAFAPRGGPTLTPAPRHADVYLATLTNGLRIVLRRNPAAPVVAVVAVARGGNLAEKPHEAGLAELMARVWTRGTHRRNAAEIARSLDGAAASITGLSGRLATSLRGDFMADTFADGLELFADILRNAAFPAAEFKRERERLLEDIRARDDSPEAAAWLLFRATLYGDHPFGRDLLGNLATVGALERSDVAEFHQRYLSPDRLVVAVSGDIEPSATLRMLQRLLGDWRPFPTRLDPPPSPQSPSALTARRDLARAQTQIIVGWPGTTARDPDRDALHLLRIILGSQSGRLFMDLRERRGLAYAVGADHVLGLDDAPGFFAFSMATEPGRVTAARAALADQIDILRRDGVTTAELLRAQRQALGLSALGDQRNATRAMEFASALLIEGNLDALADFEARMNRVTPTDISRVVERYLRPDTQVEVELGPPPTP